jgi:uncharacterized membrane protein
MDRRTLVVPAIMLLVLLAGVLLGACGGEVEQKQETSTTLDGQALVQERCVGCHDLGRVEQARKTEEEWRATVERMVSKGANLSSEEQERVIEHLAEEYPK